VPGTLNLASRQAWLAVGQQSLIGLLIPDEYGGGGTTDFRFRCVVMEEFARAGTTSISSGFGLQDHAEFAKAIKEAARKRAYRIITDPARDEALVRLRAEMAKETGVLGGGEA
jgi:alkylation response protein AidB-like acyl-CoA dehydrogenase